MTRRIQNTITEKKGINAFKTLVEDNGSIFREIATVDDIGHDANIEFCERHNNEYKSTGIEIKIQIKSGESYFNGNNAFIKGGKEHFEYWKSHTYFQMKEGMYGFSFVSENNLCYSFVLDIFSL